MREKAQPVPRLLVTITREEEQKKLEALFDTMQIPIWFQCRGKGTASSEMLDIFGLRGTTRLVTIGLLPEPWTHAAMGTLARQLSIHRRGAGIAATVPVTGLQGHVLQMLNQEGDQPPHTTLEGDESAMKESSEYAMLWACVTSGYSDEVIDAARDAGAQGGSIIKGRRRNSQRACQHFGISVQDEQDLVMMIVPRSKKAAIMTAISAVCGLQTQAHGLVWSLPVDEVMGLEA